MVKKARAENAPSEHPWWENRVPATVALVLVEKTLVSISVHVTVAPLLRACSRCTYSTRSSMVQTLTPHRFPNFRQPSLLIIPPPVRSDVPWTSSPSSTSSQITPAGSLPASRQNSTAASVWPLRSRMPPSRARKGKTCPGRLNDEGVDSLEASVRHVRARSCADIPVVTEG